MGNLDTFLESVRQKYHLPALAVAVSQEGRPDVVAAVGVRSTNEPDNHVTTDDPFHLGSCGKPVTAAVIHALADEGKLKLNDTLVQVFPDAELHPAYRDVTIADLLAHSGGLSNIPGNVAIPSGPMPVGVTAALANAFSPAGLKEQLKDAPAYARGEFHYSNLGYALLGNIAERAGGKPFETLAQEKIFDPLGMKTAGFGVPTGEKAAWGHYEGAPVRDDGVPKHLVATGGMHSSVGDWLKFLKYELGQPGLQHPSHEVPLQYPGPQGMENAGYVDMGFLRRGDVFSKDGSNGFNNARESLLPNKKAAFIVATNNDSKDSEQERQAIMEVESHIREHMITPQVPEIKVHTSDRQMLAQIKAAVTAHCSDHGINPADISDIAQNRQDGITLRLNYAEGMTLFEGDDLLDKKLGIFKNDHTAAGLSRLNEKNAALGVSISRSPSLDGEFHALVERGEMHIKEAAVRSPAPASFDELFGANQVTVVGEKRHDQEAARLSIALKLPELAAQHGALVMEGMYGNRQPLIDEYLHSSPGTPVPQLLKLSLHHSGGDNGTPGYFSSDKLLATAKEAGVPVYAFDSDAALLVNYSNRNSPPFDTHSPEYTRQNPLDYRLVTGNEEARERIAELALHYGKIIADVGGAHALPENGVPGVGDYFGGSQVIIADGNAPKMEVVRGEVNRDRDSSLTWVEGDYRQITADPNKLKEQLAAMRESGAFSAGHADPFDLSPPLGSGNAISGQEVGLRGR